MCIQVYMCIGVLCIHIHTHTNSCIHSSRVSIVARYDDARAEAVKIDLPRQQCLKVDVDLFHLIGRLLVLSHHFFCATEGPIWWWGFVEAHDTRNRRRVTKDWQSPWLNACSGSLGTWRRNYQRCDLFSFRWLYVIIMCLSSCIIVVYHRTRRWRKFQKRKPIGEVGCCESRMVEGIHWLAERWLDLCLLEWLQWLQWSPHPQLLDVVWCIAAVVVAVA